MVGQGLLGRETQLGGEGTVGPAYPPAEREEGRGGGRAARPAALPPSGPAAQRAGLTVPRTGRVGDVTGRPSPWVPVIGLLPSAQSPSRSPLLLQLPGGTGRPDAPAGGGGGAPARPAQSGPFESARAAGRRRDPDATRTVQPSPSPASLPPSSAASAGPPELRPGCRRSPRHAPAMRPDPGP